MKTEVISKIVSIEWEMFQRVNEGSPKADCQEDFETFNGMRSGQFAAWSDAAAESYLNDLESAADNGRNLVTEKYIHMMRTTTPQKYEKLMESIPRPTDKAVALANEICSKMIDATVVLHEKYPCVAVSGRPLRSSNDFSGTVSIETYQTGELLTYSEKTLKLLLEHIKRLEAEGGSLAEDIMENSVKFYGYDSLEHAEAAAQAYADAQPIEWSFGCDSCEQDFCYYG